MAAQAQKTTERRATYLGLIGLFWTLFAASSLSGRQQNAANLRPLDLTLLGLASYRMGRLAAYDKVTEPLREPFTEVQPDQTGAGETVVPQGAGVRRAIGELIACPTCTATWAAALFVYGLDIAPRPTRTLLAILGASGAAEMFDMSVEALNWISQAARKQAGS